MTPKARKLTTDLRLVVRCITEKWWPIAFERSSQRTDTWYNCALCVEYSPSSWMCGCRKHRCPVCVDTGWTGCEGTPFVRGIMSKSAKRAMLLYLIRLADKLVDQLAEELG